MGNTTDVMDRFFSAMQAGDMEAVAGLIHDDFDFAGPVMGTRGAEAFLGMVKGFGCDGMRFNFHARFENGDEACALYDLTLNTPSGRPLTLAVSDWTVVDGDRIARQRIAYDPRPMLKAFGMDPDTTYGG